MAEAGKLSLVEEYLQKYGVKVLGEFASRPELPSLAQVVWDTASSAVGNPVRLMFCDDGAGGQFQFWFVDFPAGSSWEAGHLAYAPQYASLPLILMRRKGGKFQTRRIDVCRPPL